MWLFMNLLFLEGLLFVIVEVVLVGVFIVVMVVGVIVLVFINLDDLFVRYGEVVLFNDLIVLVRV